MFYYRYFNLFFLTSFLLLFSLYADILENIKPHEMGCGTPKMGPRGPCGPQGPPGGTVPGPPGFPGPQGPIGPNTGDLNIFISSFGNPGAGGLDQRIDGNAGTTIYIFDAEQFAPQGILHVGNTFTILAGGTYLINWSMQLGPILPDGITSTNDATLRAEIVVSPNALSPQPQSIFEGPISTPVFSGFDLTFNGSVMVALPDNSTVQLHLHYNSGVNVGTDYGYCTLGKGIISIVKIGPLVQ